MNERIQELWNKAADSTAAFPSGQNNSWETQVNFMEKFAELIVQKCISIVALHGITNFENEDISWVCENIVKEVKEHFGVN